MGTLRGAGCERIALVALCSVADVGGGAAAAPAQPVAVIVAVIVAMSAAANTTHGSEEIRENGVENMVSPECVRTAPAIVESQPTSLVLCQFGEGVAISCKLNIEVAAATNTSLAMARLSL